MVFYEFLREIKEAKEVTLLHDISNKFNLLALALEDIDELFEEKGEIIDSNELKAIHKDIVAKKNKFIAFLNDQKATTRLSNISTELEEIFKRVLETNQKKIREGEIVFQLVNVPQKANLFFSYDLLHTMVGMRLIYNRLRGEKGKKIELALDVKKNVFLTQESNLAKEINSEFEQQYLSYIEALWAQWKDSL